MAFLVLGANSVSGYTVKNSLRFNSGSSDNLTRTPSSNGNRNTWTYSCWFKRSLTGVRHRLFSAGLSSGTIFYTSAFIDTDDKLYYLNYPDSSSVWTNLTTTQVFRDTSAWYHLILMYDSTQSTASNRAKIYLNGSEITALSSAVYSPQNQNSMVNSTSYGNFIGSTFTGDSGGYFSGYQSEIYLIDGQALTPSSFGETDTDTGIWKPKAYTGTYGTNGFYLQFKNSASLGTDSSGNGNTFTVNNLTSIDQTTDTPTNNFATLNSLNIDPALSYTFSNGNLEVSIAQTGGEGMTSSTLAVNKGKWYWECKLVTSSAHGRFGVVPVSIGATKNPGEFGIAWQMNDATMQLVNTVYSGSWGSNPSNNDILMFALDCDNTAFYFGVNGTWRNSGVPTSGSSRTGAVNYSAQSTLTSDFLTVGFGGNFFSGGGVQLGQYNFGNPIYSANSYTDSAGFGNFSYSVPSGFFSLNTKNLAQYG
jgi:hypothetical protein